MLPNWFKEYLSFHHVERRGVMALIFILIALIVFNIYQRVFWKSDWEQLKLQYGPSIVEFQAKQQEVQTHEKEARQPWLPTEVNYFNFNPNKLDSAGWVNLGFSPKQTAAIIRYRNAGAVFRKPEDIKKLFVVDEQKYQELKPFIRIEPIPEAEPKPHRYEQTPKPKFQPVLLELNTADTAQLQKLYGIGPSYAKRIVKYRELLGGYLSKQQLLEVYGMDSTRYLPIVDNLLVDTTFRTRLNINMADTKELMRHPYIGKNVARAITNYRTQHGKFTSIEELKKIHLINDSIYSQLRPYITVKTP